MKKRGRKSKKPTDNYLIMLYENDNMTASEIAKMYGVKTQTVYNWVTTIRKRQN